MENSSFLLGFFRASMERLADARHEVADTQPNRQGVVMARAAERASLVA